MTVNDNEPRNQFATKTVHERGETVEKRDIPCNKVLFRLRNFNAL